jgi:hypothetical protein
MTASAIRKLGASGVRTADELIAHLRLDEADACGFCLLHIDEIVDIATGGSGGEEITGTPAQGEGAKNGR